jgi:hypothetical protein
MLFLYLTKKIGFNEKKSQLSEDQTWMFSIKQFEDNINLLKSLQKENCTF